MTYEPDLDEVSRSIAAARGLCPHCRARASDCDCQSELDDYEFSASSFPEDEDEIADDICAFRAVAGATGLASPAPAEPITRSAP